jgi:hypothetical protein
MLTATTTVYASNSIQAYLFPVKFEFNGIEKKLSNEYVVLNHLGHAYVPVRFIADNMGAAVDYDIDKATISFKFGPNLFDGSKAKIGDTIAGMKVTRVDVNKIADDDTVGIIEFSGKVTISGTYQHYYDEAYLGDVYVFFVDKDSSPKLPQMLNDTRDQWFVFENQDDARSAFGSDYSKGKATITIDQFYIHLDYKETYNKAILDKVILKK